MTSAENKSIEYQEKWLEAMTIIAKKQVNEISFDKTVEATIVDASKAQNGIYTVSTGDAKFEAYSTETKYKNNDAVMVTIPQGDYDKQKMIIGKQVTKTNTPLIYQSPFQQIVNITNNVLQSPNEIGYWANYKNNLDNSPPDYCWDIDNTDFQKSNSYIYNQQPPPWDSGDIFEQGHTRLGISAQFSTWLNEYDTIAGNYGLAAEITFRAIDILDEHNQPLSFTKMVFFDSEEFFGDVYNFESYYIQEKVFDITDFIDYPIIRIKLFPYQRNNFRTFNNQNIYETALNVEETSPNIYIKEPLVCLGMEASEFEDDVAKIMCSSNLIYSQGSITINDNEKTSSGLDYAQRYLDNNKVITLRWIHKDSEKGIIKSIEPDELPLNYEIRWYRHKPGAQSPDKFAGAHWERFYGSLDYDSNRDDKSEWNRTSENSGDATDQLKVNFQPNVNRAEEKIKAIIIKKEIDIQNNTIEQLIVSSNILVFTNQDEVRNQAVFIDERALNIKFDDEDPLKGNFFIYNQADQVKNQELAETVTKIIAVFDPRKDGTQQLDIYKKAELNVDDFRTVEWIFPENNTMIIPVDENGKKLAAGNYAQSQEKSAYAYFKVKSTYSPIDINNKIFLHATTNDGENYDTELQINFGHFGDNGSDYSISIEWEPSNPTVLNLSKDEHGNYIDTNPSLVGIVSIKDSNMQIVEWPSTAQLNCSWLSAYPDGDSTNLQNELKKEKEETEIYYPVFFNSDKALNYYNPNEDENNNHNPDKDDQPNEYYYFIDDSNDFNTYNDYFNFNISNDGLSGSFDQATNMQKQLYRKCRTDLEKKNKLLFRAIPEEKFILPYDIATGELLYGNSLSNINAINIIGDGTTNSPYQKQYKYSQKQQYFIKFHDIYILDPWNDYQEVEVYYEPIEAPAIKSKYDAQGVEVGGTLHAVSGTGTDSNKLTITPTGNINTNALFILEITITGFGDYNLTKCFPIPLKFGEELNTNQQSEFHQKKFEVDGISGPTEVLYLSDGTGIIDFNRTPFSIRWRNLDLEDTTFQQYNSIDTNDFGYWRLVIPNYSNNENNIFKPNLIETIDRDNPLNDPTTHFRAPILNPVTVYIPNAITYGVQFVKNDGTVLWTQPILCWQNRYQSGTLNKWNGKEIQTDKDTGTIVASGFAAGKKESDNTFTGVMLGDWSRTNQEHAIIAKQTGIYGFNHGAMSYAFKDDGTGFIGKDGKGRIYLDGDKAQIFSSAWANTNNISGMLLDIDDGYIKMQKNSQYITLGSNQPNYPLSIGTNLNVSARNFRVKWNGNLYAKDAHLDNAYIQGEIYSEVGQIGGWTVANGAMYYTEDRTVGLSSAGINGQIHQVFNVNQEFYQNIGSLSFWTNGEWSEEDQLVKFEHDQGYFAVTNTGNLYSTSGSIGGWSIRNGDLRAPGTILYANSAECTPWNANIETTRIAIADSATELTINNTPALRMITGVFGSIDSLGESFNGHYVTSHPIGITSTNNSIVIQASGSNNDWINSKNNVALRTDNNIYLESGYNNNDGEVTKAAVLSLGSNGIISLVINDYYFRIRKNNNEIKLETNILAENQSGIYACFA